MPGKFGVPKTNRPDNVRVAAANRCQPDLSVNPLGSMVRTLVKNACVPGFKANQNLTGICVLQDGKDRFLAGALEEEGNGMGNNAQAALVPHAQDGFQHRPAGWDRVLDVKRQQVPLMGGNLAARDYLDAKPGGHLYGFHCAAENVVIGDRNDI
jgi:hypothetical protein